MTHGLVGRGFSRPPEKPFSDVGHIRASKKAIDWISIWPMGVGEV